MWSVWSERVDVYLGTGLVLVQRPGVPLWTFERPTTLPLADVLRQVDHALDRANDRPWRLHVHLSAALCPPVAFVVPEGVERYQEVLAIAQASAAQVWAFPPEQATEIVCSLDAVHLGLAAAMLTGTYDVLTRWAIEYKGRLTSLRPLWVATTGAKACREVQAQCVAVLEPDALTVLTLNPHKSIRALSLHGPHGAAETRSFLADACTQADGGEPSKGLAMAFGRDPATDVWLDGPAAWSQHWSQL